jgi:hypothetical protein
MHFNIERSENEISEIRNYSKSWKFSLDRVLTSLIIIMLSNLHKKQLFKL